MKSLAVQQISLEAPAGGGSVGEAGALPAAPRAQTAPLSRNKTARMTICSTQFPWQGKGLILALYQSGSNASSTKRERRLPGPGDPMQGPIFSSNLEVNLGGSTTTPAYLQLCIASTARN